MIKSKNTKARLFITYLKDKTELYLYVKPHGTVGSRSIYRRSPGDAAMCLRIQALLDNAGVQRSDLEIWILLYPPEIRTSTLYVPSSLSDDEIIGYVRETAILNLPYFLYYDWKNHLIKRWENGHGKDMVTVTCLGKNVLPRIKSLLYKDYPKINFIGDGLQFLALDESEISGVRGKTYELILPYDETYYKAVFRSGIHFESIGHPKGNSSPLGKGKLRPEQIYIKFAHNTTRIDLPVFQPLVSRSEWKEAFLTPSAFPSWYIARKSMKNRETVNFAALFHSEKFNSRQGDKPGTKPQLRHEC